VELAALICLRAPVWFDVEVHVGAAPNWALAATASARPGSDGAQAVTEVELVVSRGLSGRSDGQAGLGEAAVYEVAAVLNVP
jgi:hypothetical protein